MRFSEAWEKDLPKLRGKVFEFFHGSLLTNLKILMVLC